MTDKSLEEILQSLQETHRSARPEWQDPMEAIRRRPAMYIGSTASFGLIHYLVCPVAFLLAHGAKRIDATVHDGFEISSDALIKIEQNDTGKIVPFQVDPSPDRRHNLEATVLTALSQELIVSVHTGSQQEAWQFSKGVLVSHTVTETSEDFQGTRLRFKPDSTIFTITEVSEAVFASYFRRLSYLHDSVRFAFTAGKNRQEYFAPNGIIDLFTAITAPYQLMPAPIHIVGHEDDLDLQVVIAYQSWKTDHLCCFINNGRAVEGGTHEQGLLQALKLLKRKLGLPEDFTNGVVAVASLRYPGARWEGCIKAQIGNPELKPLVSRLVVKEAVQWMKEHPVIEAQIRKLQTFQFPEVWSGRL